MNRKLTGIIVAVMFLFTAIFTVAPADASDTGIRTAKFYLGQKHYDVNGIRYQMDVAPYVENQRTLIPIRFAANAIGIPDKDIIWNGDTNRVIINKGDTTVIFTLNSRTMLKNGEPVQMDVAPSVKSQRTLLPIRFVGEALDAKVDWVQETKTVIISLNENSDPGEVIKPPVELPVEQPDNGVVAGKPINMTAAKKGTLLPPPGVQAGETEWGLPAKALRVETQVGSRYATVTGLDGSTRQIDLGTSTAIIGLQKYLDELYQSNPDIYNQNNTVAIQEETMAFYIPFIPVAKAFGVPDANIVWDGKHMAIFGYYGEKENYMLATAGSREIIGKVVGNDPEVGTGRLHFPLFVKDGIPMMGITDVCDFSGMLFASYGGPGIIDANESGFGAWSYEEGTVGIGCELFKKKH